MRRLLTTVLVATAVIAAGCGGGTDDADLSPTAAPTEAADSPTKPGAALAGTFSGVFGDAPAREPES